MMRRASSKTAAGQHNNSTNPISYSAAATDLFRSASSKASSKEMERIDNLFYSYANRSSGMIEVSSSASLFAGPTAFSLRFCGCITRVLRVIAICYVRICSSSRTVSASTIVSPEGIENLCSDMEVDHTDVRILMLAWKMKAEKQGYFTLEEWRRGLKALRADTISKLKKAFPELEKEVRRTSNFADFYTYSFRYCLTEEKQKTIDIESICQLLDLVLGFQFRAQVDYFIEYIKIQSDYKVINMDQWSGFYRFCNEISFPDFSNYDPELAWPLILDNFVEWMRAKQT